MAKLNEANVDDLFRETAKALGLEERSDRSEDAPRLAEVYTKFLAVATADADVIFVAETQDDIPLAEAAAVAERVVEIMDHWMLGTRPPPPSQLPALDLRTYQGVEYVESTHGFVAKTDPHTCLWTNSEKALKSVLDRSRQNEPAWFGPRLREALENARGDSFFAVLDFTFGETRVLTPNDMHWLGFGFSIDSHLNVEGAIGFESAAVAKAMCDAGFDAGMPDDLPASAPAQARKGYQIMVDLFREIRLSQKGKMLQVSFEWSVRDLEELARNAHQIPPDVFSE
ncbi:MAG: hypothetical protein ACYTG0_19175 [Planctomycetota bacterium]